jgi:pyridoxamine 5'-phosphate oxidase
MTDSRRLATNDPLAQFDLWLNEASANELNDPNAASLATASKDAAPSVRMVLVKPVGDERFCVFTNAESQKGRELLENPRAALCFHWKTLRRQVRVEGRITELSAEASDTYFHSRSRGSQIGAAVSDQSRTLGSREELEAKARAFAESHVGEIPRPGYWRGFCLHPERIEFWMDGKDRLHDRFVFVRDGNLWRQHRLYP